MSANPKEDVFANVIGVAGSTPAVMADATAYVTAIHDRLDAGLRSPMCMLIKSMIAFTTASGNTTGRMTVLVELYHDTASNMATEALLDSDTYVFVWVADGANTIDHTMQVLLKGANRYVRAKVTITESGTVTGSAWIGCQTLAFGGMDKQPSDDFAAAGYETTLEPS